MTLRIDRKRLEAVSQLIACNNDMPLHMKDSRAFCELTGQTYIDSTSSRRAREKLWKRCFDYQKLDDGGYLIYGVREHPENACHGNDVYAPLVFNILSDHLEFRTHGKKSCWLSRNSFLKLCGCVNANYGIWGNRSHYEYLDGRRLDMSSKHFSFCENLIYLGVNAFSRNVIKALDRLARDGFVSKSVIKMTYRDNSWHEATAEEVKLYEQVRREYEKTKTGKKYFSPVYDSALKGLLAKAGAPMISDAFSLSSPTISRTDIDENESWAERLESVIDINNRSVEHLKNKTQKDLWKTACNWYEYEFGPSETAFGVAPHTGQEKLQEALIRDRIEVDLLDYEQYWRSTSLPFTEPFPTE